MFKYLIEFSLVKTLYFNFKVFDISTAIKFPVLIAKNVKFVSLKGICELGVIKFGIIKIGFNSVSIFNYNSSTTVLDISGKVTFDGKCYLGNGTKLSVSGQLQFGNNFAITAESIIICNSEISFGSDVLCSWGVQIMDTDFHGIYNVNNELINRDMPISIGNKVWFGSYSTVLKGTMITDNTIIAAKTVVSGKYSKGNVILGGGKSHIIKDIGRWER